MTKAEILKNALEKALERPIRRVWYVPIHRPCMEMQGYAGGWMYKDDEGHEDCIGGYSFMEAIEAIIVTAHLTAQTQIIDSLKRQGKLK